MLREDGVIFISIDDHEVHNLRALCNDVFGEENFVASVIWQKRYAPKNDDPGFSAMHDYLLVYRKTPAFERNLLPRSEKQKLRYQNPDNDPRGPWASGEYVSSKSRNERPSLWYPIKHPITGEDVWPDENAVWRYSPETHATVESEGRLYWGPGATYKKPRLKRYLSEMPDGVVPTTWWPFDEVGHSDEGQKETAKLLGPKVFDTPKPIRLLSRIVQVASGEGDLVMDFFAGSGAFGQAALEQSAADGKSRKYVLVQLPEKVNLEAFSSIADITRRRLIQARALKQGSADQTNWGFRSYRLSSSNFRAWSGENEPENLQGQLTELADNTVEGRSEEAILTELLLKAGFELTVAVEKIELAGKTVFSVGEGALLLSLDENVTLEAIEQMVQRDPQMIICLDEGFRGDDQLKVNAVQTVNARNRSTESSISFKVV